MQSIELTSWESVKLNRIINSNYSLLKDLLERYFDHERELKSVIGEIAKEAITEANKEINSEDAQFDISVASAGIVLEAVVDLLHYSSNYIDSMSDSAKKANSTLFVSNGVIGAIRLIEDFGFDKFMEKLYDSASSIKDTEGYYEYTTAIITITRLYTLYNKQ